MAQPLKYNTWMQRVDRQVSAWAGCSVHDLTDCPFKLWYDDEIGISQAARWALARSGFYHIPQLYTRD